MTRDEVLAILERHRGSFASRDSARLAADHVENGTFSSPAAGTVTGRKHIREVYDYWLEAFPDMVFTWGEPIIEGDRAALFWRFSGTLSGKFYGEAKAGTRIEFRGAGEYVLTPEGIVRVDHLFDFTGTLVNAGVLKVKPA